MDKKQFTEALQALKALPKRKFKQTYDLIINLRGLDLKKPEHQIELWVKLPHNKGKPTKIGAIVGPELAEQAKQTCDTVVLQDDLKKYTDKKSIKNLARSCDYFIAQANIMPDLAKSFGRVFGPLGKMPNPKAGCVVPPNANLKTLTENLKQTIKISAKVQPSIKVMIGKEDMPDEQVAENINAVYTNVVQKLPQETFNIKSVLMKLTMSQPVKVTDKGIEKQAEKPAKETTKKAPTKKPAKAEEKPAEEAAE